MLSGVYTTNLSYIPKEYQEEKWLHVCDVSKYIAEIIYNIHNDQSISSLMSDKSYPVRLVEEKFEKKID
jgi:ribose-phosphate pyrophosphokinase